jgi:ribosomal protein L37E
VQYGGLSCALRRGPVEEVSLSQFAQGRSIWIRTSESTWLDPDEVVQRARRRLGENSYHVLTNNCEHFCEWCVRGEHRSYQVDALIARFGRVRYRVIALFARALFARQEIHM